LIKTFNGEPYSKRFYSSPVTGYELSFEQNFATTPIKTSTYDAPNPMLIDMVNFFGEQKGFALIIARINSETDKISVKALRLTAKLISHLKDILVSEFETKFSSTVQKAMLDRAKNMTDEEMKTLDKSGLEELVRDVETILTQTLPAAKAAEEIEVFKLDMAYRSLLAPAIARKIFGISQIGEMIEMVDRKEKSGLEPHSSLSHGHMGSSYSSGYSSTHGHGYSMNHSAYMGYGPAYGSSYYSSSYSKPTAKFLTTETLLDWIESRKLLDVFFSSGLHQEVLKRTTPILKFVARNNKLESKHLVALWTAGIGKHESILRVVFEVVADLSKDLDENLLDLVFELVKQLNFADLPDYCFEFLDSLASNAIQNSKSKSKFPSLEFFWDMIQDSSSLSHSLEKKAYDTFMKHLLSLHCESQKPLFLSKCIDNLKCNCSIAYSLSVAQDIISSYPHYSPYSRERTQSDIITSLEKEHKLVNLIYDSLLSYRNRALLLSSSPGDTSASSQLSSHDRNLDTRLSFLAFIFSNSSLNLSREGIDLLWDVFVSRPVFKHDSIRLLTWLGTAKSRSSVVSEFLSEDASIYLFENYLSKPSLIDPKLLDEKSYLSIENYFLLVNGSYGTINHASLRQYLEVARFDDMQGIDTLWDIVLFARDNTVVHQSTSLFVTLHSSVQFTSDSEKIWNSFLTRCMHKFEDLLLRINSAENVRESTQTGQQVLDALLQFLQVIESQSAAVRTHDSSVQSPRYILSNSYFNLLFDLLSIGSTFGQNVWELLQSLPTNQELSQAITNIGESESVVDWERLLSSKSILKLLYSLQIIEMILFETEGLSSIDEALVREWSLSFVEKGGFTHILSIIQNLEDDSVFTEALPHRCLGLMLKIFAFFLSGDGAEVSEEALKKANYESILKRLLHFVWKSSINTVYDPVLEPPVDEKAVVVYQNDAVVVDDVDDKKESKDERGNACLEGPQVILRCLNLVQDILQLSPSMLNVLLKYDRLSELLVDGLLESSNRKTRKELSDGLFSLSGSIDKMVGNGDVSKKLSSVLLPILLKSLTNIAPRSEKCGEYFDIVERLLQDSTLFSSKVLNAASLVSHVVLKIKSHPIVEVRAQQNDLLLQGLLKLTTSLVRYNPSLKTSVGLKAEAGLIEELVTHCLFEIPDPSHRNRAPPPKCKNEHTRHYAFALLLELVNGVPDGVQELLNLLKGYHETTHSNGRDPDEWEFRSTIAEKGDAGYVGIRNLGCICYLNALLQQMFMIPRLRQNLLSIEDKSEDKNESFLYQLQYIFSFLQESERQYCDPTQFCHAFKEFDGTPTNTSVQKDTNEFLNLLFDRIDTQVKGTKWEKVLQQDLGGNFANELICRDCPHFSVREEPFYCMTLNVKNKKNVIEGLESFVEGEMLEGDNAYLCSTCNKKVDTLKRVVVKDLPPTLILHLKRFELDYETFQLKKLNDRCEFPFSLNMKPYTREGLAELGKGIRDLKRRSSTEKPDETSGDGKDEDTSKSELVSHPDDYYEYQLAGVLVHTGSAHGGHYYSFIKERGNAWDEEKFNQWFLFNDHSVTRFDPKDIPDECFGGSEEYSRPSYYYSMMTSEKNTMYKIEKYRNAYLLFYERVNRTTSPRASSEEITSVAVSEKKPTLRRTSSARVAIPSKIFNAIWEENATYWRDKYVFDPQYFDFLWNLIDQFEVPNKKLSESIMESLTEDVVKFSTQVFVNTISRSFYKQVLPAFHTRLVQLYATSSSSCRWLLDTLQTSSWLQEMLFECKISGVRKYFAELVLQALKITLPSEAISLIESAARTPKTIQVMEPPLKSSHPCELSVVVRFLRILMSQIRICPSYWKAFDEYFLLLARVAQLDIAFIRFFVANHFIVRLIDFYLGDETPLEDFGNVEVDLMGKRARIGDSVNDPDFSHFIELVSTLAIHSRTMSSSRPSTAPPHVDLIVLSDSDIFMLTHEKFIKKLISEASSRFTGKTVTALLKHWCWENDEMSQFIISLLLSGIQENDSDEMKPFFRIFMGLLSVEDSLVDDRVVSMMSGLLNVMRDQRKFWKATDFCIDRLVRISKTNSRARTLLKEHGEELEWILHWMRENPHPPTAYQRGEVQLKKSTGYGGYTNYGYGYMGGTSYGMSMEREEHYGLTLSEKVAAIQALISGDDATLVSIEYEDSDEGLAFVNQFAHLSRSWRKSVSSRHAL
jgi:ubiquitin C-terminal hydrolase